EVIVEDLRRAIVLAALRLYERLGEPRIRGWRAMRVPPRARTAAGEQQRDEHERPDASPLALHRHRTACRQERIARVEQRRERHRRALEPGVGIRLQAVLDHAREADLVLARRAQLRERRLARRLERR